MLGGVTHHNVGEDGRAEDIAHEYGLKATEYVDSAYISAPVDLPDRPYIRDGDILNPEDKPED